MGWISAASYAVQSRRRGGLRLPAKLQQVAGMSQRVGAKRRPMTGSAKCGRGEARSGFRHSASLSAFTRVCDALWTRVNALGSSGLLLPARRCAHGGVDGVAMAHEIGVGGDELLERRIDVVAMDIGDEAVDAGVDAGGLLAVQVAARGREVRQHLQIRDAAPVGGVGSVAPNPLEMVALEIELL